MKSIAKKITGNYYFSPSHLPIALKQVHGRELSHPYDYTAVPHCHDFAELIIITGGSGRQMISDREYIVQTGDVFVIIDDTIHSFTDYQALKITNIMFDSKLLAPYENLLARIPGYQILFCLEPELRRSNSEFQHKLHLSAAALTQVLKLLQNMEEEFSFKKTGYEAAVTAKFLDLVILLSRSFDEYTQEADDLVRLGNLLSILSTSFEKEWNLQKMAKYCSMSVNTLLRHFKRAMNQSPMQYLTQLRLEQACSNLLHTNKSISEIALKCGFSDSNYFAKKFRAVYRVSASEFRHQNISSRKHSLFRYSKNSPHSDFL